MEKELNKLLADLVVEYHKLQSFHWYLKGYHFFDDHAKLEEYYDSVAEAVDGVAENMLKLGLKPESTMKGPSKKPRTRKSLPKKLTPKF